MKEQGSTEKKYPKVAIITIQADNSTSDIIECFNSLNKVEYDNFYVILINNGIKSLDLKREIESNQYKFEIKYFKTKFNLGFSGGNNIGIKQALLDKSDYILLLNNDTTVDKNFLFNLIRFLEKNRIIAIAGPVVLNYKTEIIQSAGIFYNFNNATGIHNQKNKRYDELKGEYQEVGYIDGCAILIPSKIFKLLGLLNIEYYPGFYEETDLCCRAKKRGIKRYCVYNSKIWHKGGQTYNRNKSLSRYRILNKNRFLFIFNHSNFFRFIYFIIRYITDYPPVTNNLMTFLLKMKIILLSLTNILAIKILKRIIFLR